ncbi:TonB family protein [Roseateles sp. BYS78W]|uniref:TonB family protein n=1 Tax=Pelomonas candidula TaxID=3299025 RepID=A0ABW7H8R1_9BURK
MTAPASGSKSAAVAWSVAASLAVALAGSWLWFLRTPPAPSLDQQQLRALAAQAANPHRPSTPAAAYQDEAVKPTIREHAAEIQKPWLAYLAGKPARSEGAVTLSWTIGADGRPTQVAVTHSDFEQAALNEGVRAALAAIVFPPPPAGQPLAVTHQLFFKQEPAAR